MEISGIGNSAKDRRKFYEECKEQFGVLTILGIFEERNTKWRINMVIQGVEKVFC